MARLRLPMAKTQSGKRAPLRCPEPPVPDDGGGPDPYRRRGRVHSAESHQSDWHGNNEVGECRPLRFLVGAEPGQSGNRWQGNQLKDEAQRQPSCGSIALGHQRATPLRQRPGGVSPPKEGAPGSAAGHHRHGPQAGPHHLFHYSMLRYGQDYVDAGAEYYESQYQQRALRAAKRRAAQLGYQLAPMPDGEDRVSGVPLAEAATAA